MIYCYFNMAQLQGVLNAVVMFMGGASVDGDYLVLLRTAAILGIFIAVGGGYVKARGESAAIYVLMLALFYYGLFIPRVTVTIQDESSGAGAPVQVANVPLGIAAFSSMTSHIGYWFTNRFETFFALPDSTLNMSSHGLMGGYRAVRLAHSMQIQDPVVAQDVVYFMRDCINPEIVSSPTALTALLNSTAVWTEFSTQSLINPGRMVTLSGSSTAIGCDTAYTTLGTQLNTQVTAQKSVLAKLLSPNLNQAAANVAIDSLLPGAEGIIFNASHAASDSIKQRMVINAMNSTSGTMATVLNDPSAAMTAYATAQAESSTSTAYKVMANLARETLPLVHNTLEAVVLSVFPFLMLMIVLAGENGGAVLKSYVMTMMWVQLWAPLYAVINYIGTMGAAPTINAAANGLAGVAISNASSIYDATISTEAVAGMLTMAVPMIAYALVRGGEVAASNLAGQVTAVSQQSSGRAGEAAGSGNISAGNVSWGNLSANNTRANAYDTAPSIRSGDGAGASITGSDGVAHNFYKGADGQVHDAQTHQQHRSPITGAMTSKMEQSAQQVASSQVSNALVQARQASTDFTSALKTFTGHTDDHANTRADGTTYAQSDTGGTGGKSGSAASAGTSTNSTVGETREKGSINTHRGGAKAEVGMSTPAGSPIKAGGSVSYENSLANQYADKIAKQIQSGNLTDAKQTAEEFKSWATNYQKTHQGGDSQTGGTSDRAGSEAAFQRVVKDIDSLQASLSEAQSFSNTAQRLHSLGVSGGYDALADPEKVSGQQLQQVLSEYRGANSAEDYAKVGQHIQQLLGATDVGTVVPKTLDGKAPPTEGSIRTDDSKNKANMPGEAGVQRDYNHNRSTHGAKGPVGKSSVPEGPKAEVERQIPAQKETVKKAHQTLTDGNKDKVEGVYQTTGTDRSKLNPLSTNSQAGVVTGMAGQDAINTFKDSKQTMDGWFDTSAGNVMPSKTRASGDRTGPSQVPGTSGQKQPAGGGNKLGGSWRKSS